CLRFALYVRSIFFCANIRTIRITPPYLTKFNIVVLRGGNGLFFQKRCLWIELGVFGGSKTK
ncbi:MAG: hypothetical protein IKC85_06875, partial [Bacteroidaceae bacterium]|nr:hypothetical protein [Bacteroidaceae bacterium]